MSKEIVRLAENDLLDIMFRNRGYDAEFLENLDSRFDDVHPLDTDKLCFALHEAYVNNMEIGFIPDFDMDGIMSGVVGFAGLAELGFSVNLCMPDVIQGYGFGPKDIDRWLKQYPNIKVILTADVGVSCYEGIQHAKELGLMVLVTDHHKAESDALPPADVIVDPMRSDDTYYNPRICGAHVLHQVLTRYAELYCDSFAQSQIRRLRLFAAIGTVSDSMPVYYNNRALLRDGIAIARLIYSNGNQFIVDHVPGCVQYRRAFLGVFLALKGFAEMGKISKPEDIDEDFFGFYLAPTFNSVKRLNEDIQIAFGVFFGNHPENDVEKLLELNETRKKLVAEHMDTIIHQDNPYAPMVYFTEADGGLRGLLATKLMQTGAGPCLVITQEEDGSWSGSGRSPFWFDFLSETADIRARLGVMAAGHEQAFGFGAPDTMTLDRFVLETARCVRLKMTELDESILQKRPDFVISQFGDGDVDLDIMAFVEFLDALHGYHPFGAGFEGPNLLLKFKASEGEWVCIGKEQQHLRIKLLLGFEVLCWNQAFRKDEFGPDDEIKVWGKLNINEFRDMQTVQFIGSIE